MTTPAVPKGIELTNDVGKVWVDVSVVKGFFATANAGRTEATGTMLLLDIGSGSQVWVRESVDSVMLLVKKAYE